jgi:tripeptide aminopeptidase
VWHRRLDPVRARAADPNLFTGGHEYHSVREWASVQDMASAAATIVRLAGEWSRG